MNVMEAIMTRRTIRKFTQEEIPEGTLRELVDAARMAAYGGNIQPLRYSVITGKELREDVFATTKWAGYLTDGAPKEGERPTAYIIVYSDETVKKECMVDAGAAVTNIMLSAHEQGIGTCWIGSVNRVALREILGTPENLRILYVVALGYPAQKSRAVEMTDSIRYYLDEEGVLNVPKMSLDQVLLDVR